MGKSAPTPPPAPDPNTIIQAQTQASDQTAATQAALNNVNYSGPQGQVSYNLDPSSGQFTENVSLNPTQQAAEDAYQDDQRLGANIAGEQLDTIRGVLQNQNFQAPTLQTSVPTAALQTGYSPGGAIQYGYDPGGAVAYGYNPGGPIQSRVAPSYSPFVGASYQGATYGAPPSQGQQPAQQGPSAASDPTYGGFMKHDDSSGWIPTVNDGTDPSGAHPGMMYDFSQGWVPATGSAVNPQANQPAQPPSPVQAPAPQAPPQAPRPAQPAGPSQIDPSIASILSNPVATTQLGEYAQAKQLLDPQWQQASEQQQAQLVAQGLNPNDAGYQNAMTLFGNQQNEAYDQALFNAIGAGNTEQNTLYGQNLQSGQFANAAQAQQYAQNQGLAQFNNSAQAQQYGENQGLAQFNNAAQGQANAQNAAAANFYNTAAGQTWQQQYQDAQLANSAAQQQFQDQAYANQLPINEFTALMGNSQVAPPPSAPAQNTSVQAPNANAAYQLQQNALQSDYAQQVQNQQSGLGGLFNVGLSVLSKIPGIP